MTLSLGQRGCVNSACPILLRRRGESKGFDAHRGVNSLTFVAVDSGPAATRIGHGVRPRVAHGRAAPPHARRNIPWRRTRPHKPASRPDPPPGYRAHERGPERPSRTDPAAIYASGEYPRAEGRPRVWWSPRRAAAERNIPWRRTRAQKPAFRPDSPHSAARISAGRMNVARTALPGGSCRDLRIPGISESGGGAEASPKPGGRRAPGAIFRGGLSGPGRRRSAPIRRPDISGAHERGPGRPSRADHAAIYASGEYPRAKEANPRRSPASAPFPSPRGS